MSWYQLVSILKEGADELAKEQSTPPTSCPNDGTVLTPTPYGGDRFCTFCGWKAGSKSQANFL